MDLQEHYRANKFPGSGNEMILNAFLLPDGTLRLLIMEIVPRMARVRA